MKRKATVKDSLALPSLPSTKRQSDPITLRYVSPDRSEPHRKRKAALPMQYSPGPPDGKIPDTLYGRTKQTENEAVREARSPYSMIDDCSSPSRLRDSKASVYQTFKSSKRRISRHRVDLKDHLRLLEELDAAKAQNQALQKELQETKANTMANERDIVAVLRGVHGDLELMAHEIRRQVIKRDSVRANIGKDSRNTVC
ncbi:unnamed protein product [Penicillium pancosmium]